MQNDFSKAMASLLLVGMGLTVTGCLLKKSSTAAPTATASASPSPSITPSPSPVPILSYGDWAYPSNSIFGTEPYPYPQFATAVGMSTTIKPSLAGYSVTNCTISPALPAGLSISSSDCSITGTPSAYSVPAVYAVTAYNGTYSTTTLIALGVSSSSTAMLATAQSSYVLETGQSASIPIVEGGGAGVGACWTSFVPSGITQSPNCSLSGTPSSSGAVSLDYSDYNGGNGPPVFGGYQIYPYWYRYVSNAWQLTGMQPWYTYVELQAVSAASQPLVTYGGTLPYTQATLAVGLPVDPITPTNTGAAITSCAVSPSLPAGLSLSQSDCSISGIPTATSQLTAYTITPSSGATQGNPLTVNLTVTPSTINAMACQSGTLCLHDKMPLWDQSDPALTTYINAQTGLNLSGDPGWCGAVSGAMAISSYLQEVQTYTGLQSTAYPSPYSTSQTEYPFIYQTMLQLGTDIAAGGTDSPPNNGMVSLLGGCMQTDLLSSNGYTYPYTTSPWENVAGYKNGMPIGWLTVCTQAGGISNCHAVTVNGAEGGYFKIYDPWGTVYDGTIAITYPAPGGNDGSVGTLSYVSGSTEDFIEEESGGVGMYFSSDWILGYVYTQNGPPVQSQCEPTP